MKKDYKRIKACLLLLGSGASGILGQTATNVSAIKGGNSEQVKRGENTTVTNTSGGLFNFLFKRGNTEKTNSGHEVENTPLQEKNSDSMPKREDNNIIKVTDKKLVCLSLLVPILSPIFLFGTAVLSLAFNALTKVPAIFNGIFKTFKTGMKFGNKKSHQLLAKLKKYNLSSFKEMIERSHEERENKDKSYDTSQEKVYRNLDLAGMVVEKKGMRRKDYIKSTEGDIEFLQQIFKEYGLNYEGSKQNKRDFNVALKQLAILFCHENQYGNSQQDESKFEDYFCTLNYEESKKEEEVVSVKDKKGLKKADIRERFNKKGVIELLYNWSKEKDDMDDDLKIKIEELYRIINEKYDHWKKVYKELSKLYDSVNSKLQTSGGFKFTVKKENFLKAKLKGFTRTNYDLEYLIKILNEPQKYPTLKEEFLKKIENLGIKYYKEFDNLIVNICETAKENEQIDNGEINEENCEKYFKLLKNIEKTAKNENFKNEFCKLLSKFKGDLKQSENIIHNKCIGFENYEEKSHFLKTIDLVIPYILGENTDIINRISKDKYSEEDIKTFFTANDPNCIKMEKIIINEINNIEIMPLPLSIEDLRNNKLMSRIRNGETLTPEKILDILENNEKTAVDNRAIKKLLKWCEDRATDELHNKIKKIYENKDLQSQNYCVVKEEKNKDLEKKEVKLEKTKYNEKDLEELFEKRINLDLEEIAGTELILNPCDGEENFSKILLNIIKNGENVKIDNKLIEKTFFSNNVSEGKIIRTFLNWCKKNATEEYCNKLEKIYVKKEFKISG